jgi:folate-binding protein YgfZ
MMMQRIQSMKFMNNNRNIMLSSRRRTASVYSYNRYSVNKYEKRPFIQYLRESFPKEVVSEPLLNTFESKSQCAAVNITSSKSLITLSGSDTLKLLQGIVTHHVIERFGKSNESVTSLNTVALNARGRVLYDTVLTSVKRDNENKVLLECSAENADFIYKHLNACKLRAKVDITQCDRNKTLVYSVFGGAIENHVSINELLSPMLEQAKLSHSTVISPDPRSSDVLGYKLYLEFKTEEAKQEWQNLQHQSKQQSGIQFYSDPQLYDRLRMLCGIAEGTREIQPQESLPLEYNYDLLDGIHWDKGCYVGQELTARTHFTGQIRKRVFPVYLKDNEGSSLSDLGDKLELCSESKAETTTRKSSRGVGKLISHTADGKLGLAIVRFENIIPNDSDQSEATVCIADRELTVVQPFWMTKNDLYPTDEDDEDEEEEEYLFE